MTLWHVKGNYWRRYAINSICQIDWCIPVTNKEWWMHKRSWSWYIRAGPCRPLSARQNRRLIRHSNTAAGCREGRGMVLPTVIRRIHGRKSIGSWHLTRWAPVIIYARSLWNITIGIWGWGMDWSKVSNIWARMSRWYSCLFSKDSMLPQ